MAWYKPPVRPSQWSQPSAPNPAAGYSQVQPGGPGGFNQVTDKNDPAARSYALARLHAAVAGGLLPTFLPEWNRDPAAAWRGVSGLLASSGAFQGGGGTPSGGAAGLVNPPAGPGEQASYPTPSSGLTGAALVNAPPPARHWDSAGAGPQSISALASSLGNVDHVAARSRIAEMAHALAPGATMGRITQNAAFSHMSNSGNGPAEGAFGRLAHVQDVHHTARALASALASRRSGLARG